MHVAFELYAQTRNNNAYHKHGGMAQNKKRHLQVIANKTAVHCLHHIYTYDPWQHVHSRTVQTQASTLTPHVHMLTRTYMYTLGPCSSQRPYRPPLKTTLPEM